MIPRPGFFDSRIVQPVPQPKQTIAPSFHAPALTEADRRAFRESLRAFVDQRLSPFVDAWEEAGSFPRALYYEAASIGLLGLGFPEDLGGTPSDAGMAIVVGDELSRVGAGGINASLMSHAIALPPIIALGTAEQKARFVPPVLRGEKIAALAVTEPGGGSDVASLRTTARREGDHFIVDGEKTFITSGLRADLFTTAVRTGGPGAEGISVLVIEGDAPGLERTELKKMGWWSSDTASLHFDACRVPASNLVGPENGGFLGLMLNFNHERLMLATQAWASAKVCYEEALAWARDRVTFGRPLITRQVIRHKLVDMRTKIEVTGAFLHSVAARMDAGESPVAEICMLKNQATQCVQHGATEAVQILGAAGYMRGMKSERIYRETKVLAIGGGTEEIMKELAAKQLGF